MLSVKEGTLELLPSPERGPVDHYNVFELQCIIRHDMSLGFLAQSSSRQVDWSFFALSDTFMILTGNWRVVLRQVLDWI